MSTATLTSLTTGRRYLIHGQPMRYVGRTSFGMHLFREGVASLSVSDVSLRRMLEAGEIIPASTRGVAQYCAWGDHWLTPEDLARYEAGAVKSHGCCPEHESEMMDDPGPEPAA